MTVHMIRLFISQNADDVLLQPETGYLAVWLNNHEAWTDEHHGPNDMPDPREPIEDGAEAYYAADWRFVWNESKSVLIDNLVGHVDAYSPWWRLGYHECTHDEENGGPCSWDDSQESGTIPTHIPDFEVTA
jgi:hypothetical protein